MVAEEEIVTVAQAAVAAVMAGNMAKGTVVVEFTVTDEERILDPSTRMLAQHKKW